MLAATHGFSPGARFLILGAGYVGGAVATALLARGAQVTALTRNVGHAAGLADRGCRPLVSDLASDEWHAEAARGGPWTGALACVSSGGGGEAGYWHSYAEGLRSVARWTERPDVAATTLVYTSSTSVYPQGGGIDVTEDAPAGAEPGTIRALRIAEEAALGARVAHAFVLRLAGIYGPGRHHLLDQLRAGVSELPGAPDHRLNLIHRDDIVAAVLAAWSLPPADAAGTGSATARSSAILNLADGAPGTRAEVVGWLCALLGRSLPDFTGAVSPVARGGRVVPDRRIVSDRARAVLGWAPQYRDYREGFAPLLGA